MTTLHPTLYDTVPAIRNRINRLSELTVVYGLLGASGVVGSYKFIRTDENYDVGQVIASLDALRDSVLLLHEAGELGRIAAKRSNPTNEQ